MKKIISFMLVAMMIFSMGNLTFADSISPENYIEPLGRVDVIDIVKHGYINESFNIRWNNLVAGNINLRALTTWIETWEVDEYGIKRRLISETTPKITPNTSEYDYYMLPTFNITILDEYEAGTYYTIKYRVESVQYGRSMTDRVTAYTF